MLNMLLYAIGIMYTPGPVNIMGFSLGLNKNFKQSIPFFFGVSCAMFVLFTFFGYTGEKIVKKEYLIYVSFLGCSYIIYLAFKVFKSSITLNTNSSTKILTFKDGFIMQFFNPKAILAALPITTLWFPSYRIEGIYILIASILFMFLVFGAPSLYCLLGTYFNSFLTKNNILSWVNKLLAVLLLYVAYTIFRDHIYLVLKGVNEY